MARFYSKKNINFAIFSKNFPFYKGLNEVELRITDNTNETKILKFNFMHDLSLLAVDKTSYSYNLGFLRDENGINCSYDKEKTCVNTISLCPRYDV